MAQDVETPQAAFNALLGSKASYSEDLNVTAPFRREDVSWPEQAGGASLVSSLPRADRECVTEARERLSLTPEELRARVEIEGKPRPHWDEVLREDEEAYVGFVEELARRGMVSYELSCDDHVAIFFVRKKSGQLRMIVDARRLH